VCSAVRLRSAVPRRRQGHPVRADASRSERPTHAPAYERQRQTGPLWSSIPLGATIDLDEVFVLRKLTDFTFLVVSLTRLRRAAQLAAGVPELQLLLSEAIGQFDRALPGLNVMRNVGEHIDDYGIDQGRNKAIARQSLEVASLEEEGPTLHWLGAKLNAHEALEAGRHLFVAVKEASRAFQTSAQRGVIQTRQMTIGRVWLMRRWLARSSASCITVAANREPFARSPLWT
jgi:hypothetical protein